MGGFDIRFYVVPGLDVTTVNNGTRPASRGALTDNGRAFSGKLGCVWPNRPSTEWSRAADNARRPDVQGSRS
jgi:hypothetical protein